MTIAAATLDVETKPHIEAILASLNSLFTSKQFSDIAIKAFDHTFNLHRPILVSNSYFSSLFNGEWSDQNTDVLELTFDDPNITLEAVQVVFGRIYGIGNDEISKDSVCSLLATACFFDDQSLCEKCIRFIEGHTMAANISRLLKFADTYSYGQYSSYIIEYCLLFLCRNAVAFPNCLNDLEEKWLLIVLSSKFLVVENERKRYNLILTVFTFHETLGDSNAEEACKDGKSRHQLANVLSKSVIFSQLSMSKLVEIRKQNLVAEDLLMKAQWRRGVLSSMICSVSKQSAKLNFTAVVPKSFRKAITSVPAWNEYDFEPYRTVAPIPADHFQQNLFGNDLTIVSFFYGGSVWKLSTRLFEDKLHIILSRRFHNDGLQCSKKVDFACDERPLVSVRFQLFLFKGNKLVINSASVCFDFKFGCGVSFGAVPCSKVLGKAREPIEELVMGCNMILK
ncbi:hypothetical protein BDR26DRAFT_1008467 [Obelidium mucronatum]|nr:hypothetical protein BDR26DRAFT_1008467 [Obelidium mucronatum]